MRKSSVASGGKGRTRTDFEFVLDSNHVSELTHRTRAGLCLLQRLDAANQDTAVSAITIEESLRDWLAEIRRNTEPQTFSIE